VCCWTGWKKVEHLNAGEMKFIWNFICLRCLTLLDVVRARKSKIKAGEKKRKGTRKSRKASLWRANKNSQPVQRTSLGGFEPPTLQRSPNLLQGRERVKFAPHGLCTLGSSLNIYSYSTCLFHLYDIHLGAGRGNQRNKKIVAVVKPLLRLTFVIKSVEVLKKDMVADSHCPGWFEPYVKPLVPLFSLEVFDFSRPRLPNIQHH
jgi:hypothetical protein